MRRGAGTGVGAGASASAMRHSRSPSPPSEPPPDRIIVKTSDLLNMQIRVQSCIKVGIPAVKETYEGKVLKHVPITVYPKCTLSLESQHPSQVYGEGQIRSVGDSEFSEEYKNSRVFYDSFY